MPVLPNLIERHLLPRLNKRFGHFYMLLQDVVSTGAFNAIAMAIRLGLFDILESGPLRVEEVASRIRADRRGVRIFLDALVAFGYLKRGQEGYSNTRLSRTLTGQAQPASFASLTRNFESLVFEFWRVHLEEAIRSGKPNITMYKWFNERPDRWQIFNDWEMAVARSFGDIIVSGARIPAAAKRLLDVGGGHGLYSVLFCRRYPQIHATVFDMSKPLETAKQTIHSEEMETRVSLQPGDYVTDELGEGYDVALLFNIIHAHAPDENTALLRKVSSALNPGGMSVIWDNIEGTGLGPLSKAIIAFLELTYLTGLGGQTYTYDEVSEMLRNAGFTKIRQARPKSLGLISAVKP